MYMHACVCVCECMPFVRRPGKSSQTSGTKIPYYYYQHHIKQLQRFLDEIIEISFYHRNCYKSELPKNVLKTSK